MVWVGCGDAPGQLQAKKIKKVLTLNKLVLNSFIINQ